MFLASQGTGAGSHRPHQDRRVARCFPFKTYNNDKAYAYACRVVYNPDRTSRLICLVPHKTSGCSIPLRVLISLQHIEKEGGQVSSLLIGDIRCKTIRPLRHETSNNSSIQVLQLPFGMLSHEQDAAKRNIPFTERYWLDKHA